MSRLKENLWKTFQSSFDKLDFKQPKKDRKKFNFIISSKKEIIEQFNLESIDERYGKIVNSKYRGSKSVRQKSKKIQENKQLNLLNSATKIYAKEVFNSRKEIKSDFSNFKEIFKNRIQSKLSDLNNVCDFYPCN